MIEDGKNIEHSTFNAQEWRVAKGEDGGLRIEDGESTNIEHRTFNAQPPMKTG